MDGDRSSMLLLESTDGALRLEFTQVTRLGDRFGVAILAPGLSARGLVHGLSAGDGLPAFVAGLAERYRGWTGVLRWSSLEDDLGIEATWSVGGHVLLDVHLRSDPNATWGVRARFRVEAGTHMQTFASDLTDFFGVTP